MFVLMVVGIDENRGKPPLQRDRLLARRVLGLDGKRHHLGGKTHVVDLPR